MRISHSKIEAYTACPRKYKFQYLEKLGKDETPAALVFGSSIDRALNYVLLRTKHKHIVHAETAKALFDGSMSQWYGQNPLLYFKGETLESETIEGDTLGNELRCWAHLRNVGSKMIDTYIIEILPLFTEIVSVQTKREIPNADGDVLVLITDFTARMPNGDIVLFDNKTSSDIVKQYGATSVAKSSQLALYTEFEGNRKAGYVALGKKLKDGKVQWVHRIDTISEELVDKTFDRVDETLKAIKEEKFDKNEKNCWAYGRICPYFSACKKNDYTGLIKK